MSWEGSVIMSPRRTNNDATVLTDYVLLEQFALGRNLVIKRAAGGHLSIAEIDLEFAEQSMIPPLKDCYEVFKAGAIKPGTDYLHFRNSFTTRTTTADFYELAVNGDQTNNDLPRVWCEDGWTYVLIRDPTALTGATNQTTEDVTSYSL